MSDFPQPSGAAAAVRAHLDRLDAEGTFPELRAALAPYLERHDGDPVRAVAELMTDLRAAAAADGTDFDAAADAIAARTGVADPVGDGHD
jgi:hypothetical protein